MPEKPEVITVSKTLEHIIIGKTIKKVDVYWDNIIIGDIDKFKRFLGESQGNPLYLRKSLCFAEHVLRTYDFLDKHP